jgi:hypothetical protein
MTKENVGAWLVRVLRAPEPLQKIGSALPWGVVVVGLTIFFLGFGLDFSLKNLSSPEVKGASDTTIREPWIWLGLALVAFGLVSAIPFIRKDDPQEDSFWPRRPRPAEVTDKPVLLMHSPLAVDREQTLRMLKKFGRTWPSPDIRWPRSSTQLLEALSDGLKNQHLLQLEKPAAQRFLRDASPSIAEAKDARSRAAARLPGLVQRCESFDSNALATVIQSFLALANYKAHWVVESRTSEARDFGLEFKGPKSWEVFKGDAYRSLYDADRREMWQGQLVSIAGHPVLGDRDLEPGLWIHGPQFVFRHRRTIEDAPYFMLIAQIEWMANDKGLPPTYNGEWRFACYKPNVGSGMGIGDADPRVKTDPEIHAELVRLQEMWRASKSQPTS